MRIRLCWFAFIPAMLSSLASVSQTSNDTINKEHVANTITYLASDELKGRVNYTKEQWKAAEYISKELGSYGLQPYPAFDNFFQPFRTTRSKKDRIAELKWNDKKVNDSLFYFFPRSLGLETLTLDSFIVLQTFPPVANEILRSNWASQENILIQIVLNDSVSFSEAVRDMKLPDGLPVSNILVVGKRDAPTNIQVTPDEERVNKVLYNVIGMLPGRSKPDEVIIFSAHYDHVDRGINGESGGIYNGANDNASGTTAVLELARYFSMRKDNERTIVFCLFAGEELGLLGSQAFINYVKPENIKAVINIEMIGRTNIGDNNTYMLTGAHYSSLYSILKQNLPDDVVKIVRQRSDPNYLFQRSDNYTFAKEGIPAHTIMGSDDEEPCYHRPCDDVSRINMSNMTRFIKAIAQSVTTLISGKDTPTRITGF